MEQMKLLMELYNNMNIFSPSAVPPTRFYYNAGSSCDANTVAGIYCKQL